MKKAILMTMFALLYTSGAWAQSTHLRLVGAQAYRNSIYQGIEDILKTGYTYAYVSSSGISSANVAIFSGTTKTGSIPVIIKVSLAGSTGGIQTVTQNLNASFLADSTPATTTGTAVSSSYETDSSEADATQADSFQSTTQFTSPVLTDYIIGVEPNIWVKNSGAPAGITNIAPWQAQDLLAGGLPLAQLTGTLSDSGTTVYAVGRDENSGVRLVAFAESGYGIFIPPIQFEYLTGGSTAALYGHDPVYVTYPADTVLGTTYPVGEAGYSSSTNVLQVIGTGGSATTPFWDTTNGTGSANATELSTGGYLITYLAASDANGFNGGANNLSWNGVAYSLNALEEGLYTFWSYSHLMYRSGFSGNAQTVALQIATDIYNSAASVSGDTVSNMKVGRTSDGSVVLYGYSPPNVP